MVLEPGTEKPVTDAVVPGGAITLSNTLLVAILATFGFQRSVAGSLRLPYLGMED